MKNALQNPFVVGILAMVALYVVYKNVFAKPTYASPPAASSPPKKSGAQPAAAQSPLEKIDAMQAQWATLIARNPFSAEPEEEEKAEVVAVNALGEHEPVHSTLKLSAICIEGGSRFAVVDDTVLTVGDSILSYTVEEILRDQIVLNGPTGHVVVGFSEVRKLPRAASGRLVGDAEEDPEFP